MSYLNLAAQIIYGINPGVVEPTCIDCGTILCEAEEEEGRCQHCLKTNAMDVYLTGLHPDVRMT